MKQKMYLYLLIPIIVLLIWGKDLFQHGKVSVSTSSWVLKVNEITDEFIEIEESEFDYKDSTLRLVKIPKYIVESDSVSFVVKSFEPNKKRKIVVYWYVKDLDKLLCNKAVLLEGKGVPFGSLLYRGHEIKSINSILNSFVTVLINEYAKEYGSSMIVQSNDWLTVNDTILSKISTSCTKQLGVAIRDIRIK